MKNNSKILLSSIILFIISTLCFGFAKNDNMSPTTINQTKSKSANGVSTQTYSFTEQPFNAIELAGAFEMVTQVVHKSRVANVAVTGSNNLLPYVKVYVKDKTLHVYFRKDNYNWEYKHFKKNNRIKIFVNIDNLKSVKIRGYSNCHVNNIRADNFTSIINGYGNIALEGSVKNLTAEIYGSGEIRAKELTAEQAKVAIYGTGYVAANTTKKIGINIQGSGTVEYYGNPIKIEQSISGSGKIKSMEK